LILTAIFRIDAIPLTILALVLLFIFGSLGLMGQGDVKLIMALTAIIGIPAALISTGIAFIVIVAVQLLLYPVQFFDELKNTIRMLLKIKFKEIGKEGRSVPLAPYILAGFAYLMIYRLFLP
jgi:Flp pilus assembly protein protease CpaA